MQHRTVKTAALLAVVALAWAVPLAAQPPKDTVMPATAPAAGSAVMATVNGKPIYMEGLVTPLVEVHGAKLGRVLVLHEVVEQEARRRKIDVTDAETRAVEARMLGRIFGDELSPDTKQRMLDAMLRQRGLTRPIWRKTVRQNAQLRRMVEPAVTVTDAMVKVEFARRYGEKVQISHIALPTLQEAEKVVRLLKQGKDFARLAEKYSTNAATAAKGGLLPPFARNDEGVPRAMRDMAFTLKPDEVSGIVQSQGRFHVLKLHKRFPSTDVKLEAVRDTLAKDLRERMVERAKLEVLRRLNRSARIEYVDPLVRKAVDRANAP
ncbi:MAG: peptidylprolyl isomerase [Planctomycetota bacterium]